MHCDRRAQAECCHFPCSHTYTQPNARFPDTAQPFRLYMTVLGAVSKLLVLGGNLSHTLITEPRDAPGHGEIRLVQSGIEV